MQTRLFAIGLLLCEAAYGQTMPRTEICRYRALLVQSFAQARDAGRPERQTAAEVKRELSKLGPGAGDMRSFIRIVYTNPDISPQEFRTLTEISCLQGD